MTDRKLQMWNNTEVPVNYLSSVRNKILCRSSEWIQQNKNIVRIYVQNKTNYYQLTYYSIYAKRIQENSWLYYKKIFCNTTWNKYIRKQQYLKFRYCFVYYVLAIKCKVKFLVAQNKLLPKISLNLQKNAN